MELTSASSVPLVEGSMSQSRIPVNVSVESDRIVDESSRVPSQRVGVDDRTENYNSTINYIYRQ